MDLNGLCETSGYCALPIMLIQALIIPTPLDFPDPTTAYQAWLQRWPHPTRDNDRCLHFVQTSWLDVEDAQLHIDQLRQLNAGWVVVPYANHFQLHRLAPLFAQAELMVLWHPFIRPLDVRVVAGRYCEFT